MNISELLGEIGKTEESDKISYSAGVIMAQSLKDIGFDSISYDDYIDGMQSVFDNKESKITKKRAIEIFQNYVILLQEEVKIQNAELGKQFLEKNSTKPAVFTLPNGLQYEVIFDGNGEVPTLESTVKVIYEGSLIDKTIFDSTEETGPQIMKVSQTLLGWQDALQMMAVGSRWRLYIPPHLAYGEFGAQPMIQPNATLVFIVELLEIVD